MTLFGRVGIATSGIVHLLIGLLAIRIAFGPGDQKADHHGAIDAVAHQSFGRVLLVLLVIGLVVLAIWYASKAYRGGKVGDGHRAGIRTRIGLAALSLFTATLAIAAGKLALSAYGSPVDTSGGGGQEKQAVDRVLDWPGGELLVIAAAIGLVYWGYKMLMRAVDHEFLEQFRRLPKHRRQIIDPLGQAGFAALAVVRWIAAWFLFKAAIDHDPNEAVGLDGALREIVDRPYGPWLLLAVALGMAAFGIFRLFDASWRSRSFL
jgi:fumarate reductase subunit D